MVSVRKQPEVKPHFSIANNLSIKVTSINFFNSHIYRLWHVIHTDTYTHTLPATAFHTTSLEFFVIFILLFQFRFLFSSIFQKRKHQRGRWVAVSNKFGHFPIPAAGNTIFSPASKVCFILLSYNTMLSIYIYRSLFI